MSKSLVRTGWRYQALAACRGGNSAAEFALILPLLLTLIFGILQSGAMMFSYIQMVSSARDTTRAMATCTILTAADARQQAGINLPKWVAAASWTITPVFSSNVSTTISVDAKKAAILTYIPFNIGTLTTTVTMRREPLAFGGGSC